MEQKQSPGQFSIRLMQPHEIDRVAELVVALQLYQKLSLIRRLPTAEQLKQDLVREEPNGKLLSNNNNTFVAVAINESKLEDTEKKSYIVGYLIYSQQYSIYSGRRFYDNSFFIEESYRFQGLGKRLVEFLQAHGKSLGNDHFDVPFMLNNNIGINFYKKMGAKLKPEEYWFNVILLDSLKEYNDSVAA